MCVCSYISKQQLRFKRLLHLCTACVSQPLPSTANPILRVLLSPTLILSLNQSQSHHSFLLFPIQFIHSCSLAVRSSLLSSFFGRAYSSPPFLLLYPTRPPSPPPPPPSLLATPTPPALFRKMCVASSRLLCNFNVTHNVQSCSPARQSSH